MLPAPMPDFCPYCGEQHPDDFLFCPKTGRALREGLTPSAPAQRPMRWEYTDVTIPLNIRHPIGKSLNFGLMWENVRPQVDSIILAHLQHYGAEGWQADDATDAESLRRARRIRESEVNKQGFWGGQKLEAWLYESATIRLKRLVPG
jgi:hypothetical protein